MVNIENVYTDYNALVGEFGRETIEDRFKIISTEMQDFFKSIKGGEKLHIDDIILMHAILDYFSDVSRLKSFHKIKNINDIKIISCESFWLLRRKPIQVNSDETIVDDKLAFANEKFVFSRIASYLANSNGKINLLEEASRKAFYNFGDTFYYFLKYRNYDYGIPGRRFGGR